jgi:hypothetical protein
VSCDVSMYGPSSNCATERPVQKKVACSMVRSPELDDVSGSRLSLSRSPRCFGDILLYLLYDTHTVGWERATDETQPQAASGLTGDERTRGTVVLLYCSRV